MSVDCDGGEPCDVYRRAMHNARKEHRCDACDEMIAPGARYSRTFAVWDGRSDTIIRCARCEVIYEHLCRVSPDGETPDWKLDCGHTYEEVHEEPAPEWLAALAFWLPGDPLPERKP